MPLPTLYPVSFNDLQTVDGTTYRGGYCSVADVQLLFLNTDNWQTLKANNVLWETMIADAAQDIDRALEPYYVVPITGTNSLELMRFINKHMAASSIHEMLANNSGAHAQPEVHQSAAVVHQEKASQRLDDVTGGVSQLFDAVARTGGEKPAFPAGKAAGWNVDLDAGGVIPTDPISTGPLFGVRDEPLYVDDEWLP